MRKLVSQVAEGSGACDHSNQGVCDFLTVGDDELCWELESVVSVVAISSHFVGVADGDSVLSHGVVNAGS